MRARRDESGTQSAVCTSRSDGNARRITRHISSATRSAAQGNNNKTLVANVSLIEYVFWQLQQQQQLQLQQKHHHQQQQQAAAAAALAASSNTIANSTSNLTAYNSFFLTLLLLPVNQSTIKHQRWRH